MQCVVLHSSLFPEEGLGSDWLGLHEPVLYQLCPFVLWLQGLSANTEHLWHQGFKIFLVHAKFAQGFDLKGLNQGIACRLTSLTVVWICLCTKAGH